MSGPAILFVTAGQIGDAVLTTGLLAHLIEINRGARLTIVAAPLPAQLFRAVPGLERLIPIAKQRYRRHWLELYRELRGRRWDIAVDLRGSALTSFLRAGKRYAMAKGDPREHRVVQLARLMNLTPPPAPKLWTAAADRDAAARLIGDGPVLAVAPAANWPGKRWPADRFAELVTRMTGAGGVMANARVAVFAAPGEREQAAPVMAAIPSARRIDMTGGLDLGVVAAALGRARLFIGNDSGLMHIAAAMRVPTLGLFGPTSATVYAPWGEFTAVARTDLPRETLERIAAEKGFAYEGLMDSLPLDRVEAAAAELFRRSAL